MSVDIKSAVRSALEFVREMYEGDDDLKTLALEEVELSDDQAHWLVTIGLGGEARASTYSVVAGAGTPRQFKCLAVHAESGHVISMKARPR